MRSEIGRRLRQEEKAQILYMTVIMMMLLTMFTLVLTNVIYMAAMKVRAQNAADALALSVATRQARILNKITEINGVIEYGILVERTKRETPYTILDVWLYYLGLTANPAVIGAEIFKYNDEIKDIINRIKAENGLDNETTKLGIYSWKINPLLVVPEALHCFYLPPPPEMVPVPLGAPLLTKFEPIETPWAVQSRVEWRMLDAIIGGRRLNLQLPDLVTRGRAEIHDTVMTGSSPWNHNWRVRLVQPIDDVDEYIKSRMR
ncbi:Tad domain-containing protein [bacterium]|nr:Tad domain-containing protein [bacterium]